jgi:hypothetical protein
MHYGIQSSRKYAMNVSTVASKIKLLFSVKVETPTDFELAVKIVDMIDIDWTNPDLKIIDPVCGRGNFLLALVQKLEQYHTREHIIKNMLYGIDVNKIQSSIAKKALQLLSDVQPNIYNTDSFEFDFPFTFDLLIGSYPFNDDSKQQGRNTNKLKENTSDLDVKFYHHMLDKSLNHAVIMRGGFLSKKSQTRENMFTDQHVTTFMNVAKHYPNVSAPMCVFRNISKKVKEKQFIDKDGHSIYQQTNKTSKISINITKETTGLINELEAYARKDNFGNYWTRSPIIRSNPQVNETTGIQFIPITGKPKAEFNYKKFNGSSSVFKNLNKWKLITNVNAGQGGIGPLKVIGPDIATSNSIVYFAFNTKEEAETAKQFLESALIKFVTPLLKTSNGNSGEFFSKIPYVDFTKKAQVKKLYSIYEKYKEMVDK